MKRELRFWAAAVLLLWPLRSPAQSSKVTSVEKVTDGVWMAQTDKGSNTGWFLLGDEVVAVDTGSDAETGKALVEKIRETSGKSPRFVVITHAHGDHAGGLGAFAAAGAQAICYENAMPSLAPLAEAAPGAKLPLLTLSQRLAFIAGPRAAAVYFVGPAHTPSDLVVFLTEERVLFSGDVALVQRAPYMRYPDVNLKGWEKALNNLAELNPEKIVPGHGPLGTRQSLTDDFAYVKKVDELSQVLLRDHVPDDLIEARLRQPDLRLEAAFVTPGLIANLQEVLRSEKAQETSPKPSPLPTPKPTPSKKKM